MTMNDKIKKYKIRQVNHIKNKTFQYDQLRIAQGYYLTYVVSSGVYVVSS